TKRVHCAFKNKLTPFAVLNKSEYYVSKLSVECKNRWTYSMCLLYKIFMLLSPHIISVVRYVVIQAKMSNRFQ
ncbi:MAG: hypothetical protein NTU76_00415, partial [Candidatus Taylorbacteria bacterium]|nr:hypothetical protein [Candidatus Taylorbacteria bacterium]